MSLLAPPRRPTRAAAESPASQVRPVTPALEPPREPAPPRLASWVEYLGAPRPEDRRTRLVARLGGLTAITSLLSYLTWRIAFTLPAGTWNVAAAWALLAFEAVPLIGLVLKTVTLWNIDTIAPPPVTDSTDGYRVAVLIPTYNEPLEVLLPTVAAACELQPAHETWVLDDGARPWVAEMAAAYGARYLSRPDRDHAKAGNLNFALQTMAEEERQGAEPVEIIAVLDCDHVPLPGFLTTTLGWFADEKVALVQGPQAFYNGRAFDDDGLSGEQGLFFNVLMRARHHADAGPFWCGSTALLRVAALREIGGIATETITEDMHTTLRLIRAGWHTAYHHQTLAVGLAPQTPEQYLLQRRRWGMGAMQVLTAERLWAAKRWMSWRNYYEYITGTLWWLEGIATLIALAVPAAVLLSRATISSAGPVAFSVAFAAMFTARLWGVKRLLRKQIHWPTAFALRVLRVPIGLACLWWLLSRNHLEFEVTPKAGSGERRRGRAPRILWTVLALIGGLIAYAAAAVGGATPSGARLGSTIAAGIWLVIAATIVLLGLLRIRSAQYATSRRNAHRVDLDVEVCIDGTPASLADVSTGGAAVLLRPGTTPIDAVTKVELPGSPPIAMDLVRTITDNGETRAALRIRDQDWPAYRALSLWLFHTAPGAVPGLPGDAPVIAVTG